MSISQTGLKYSGLGKWLPGELQIVLRGIDAITKFDQLNEAIANFYHRWVFVWGRITVGWRG